eukprot:5477701-Lingulodinium_polyedra.AAC.1
MVVTPADRMIIREATVEGAAWQPGVAAVRGELHKLQRYSGIVHPFSQERGGRWGARAVETSAAMAAAAR